jgi:NAD-dependent deacetylase
MTEVRIEQVAKTIQTYRNVVALTGAGISAESGIIPFRGPGGLWEKFDPEEFGTLEVFMKNPVKSWEFFKFLSVAMLNAQPNAAHVALAEMEQKEFLKSVITQNVDGLHQKAGTKTIVEFHGNHNQFICLRCKKITPAENISLENVPVHCGCGFPLKPNVVLFGEMLPVDALKKARQHAEHCEIMLVIGTSAQVFPASQIPIIAKSKGALIYEINCESTPLTSYISNGILLGKAGEILPQLASML